MRIIPFADDTERSEQQPAAGGGLLIGLGGEGGGVVPEGEFVD